MGECVKKDSQSCSSELRPSVIGHVLSRLVAPVALKGQIDT